MVPTDPAPVLFMGITARGCFETMATTDSILLICLEISLTYPTNLSTNIEVQNPLIDDSELNKA